MEVSRTLGLVLGMSAVACGGTEATDEGGPETSPGTAGATGSGGSGGIGTSASGGSGGAGDPCADDDGDPAPASVCIGSVIGRIVQEDGTPPPPGDTVSVCGPICHFGESDSDGNFVVEIGRHIVLSEYSTLPHGRPLIAGYYYPLPTAASGPVLDIGEIVMVRLPDAGAAIDVDGQSGAQSLGSGSLTLEIDVGVETRLEIDDVLAGPEGSQFRSRAIDEALFDVLGVGDLGLSALYAMGPFEAQFLDARGDSVGARIVFDNDAELPSGTSVELLALGSYLHPEGVTPAAFEPVATGVVSTDGARIEMADGEHVDLLTWIGIRAVNGAPP